MTGNRRSKERRNLDEVVSEATRHAVPGLPTPKSVAIVPFTVDDQIPPLVPAPAPEPMVDSLSAPSERVEETAATAEDDGPVVDSAAAPSQQEAAAMAQEELQAVAVADAVEPAVERPSAPEPPMVVDEPVGGGETTGQVAEPATKARRSAKARAGRGVVRPTTSADCKGDGRVKHTLMVHKDVQRRLAELQFEETMAAGREQPMWPHVDAALAVLHPSRNPDLAKWIGIGEELLGYDPDEFTQFGPLMRGSTREGIRTLRVRLKMADAGEVAQHHVVTAALIAYLDVWDAQGRSIPQT